MNNLYEIQPEDKGRRLDKVLMEHFDGLSFGRIQKLCRTGQIRLDGKRIKGNERIEGGQVLRLPPHWAANAKSKEPKAIWHLSAEEREDVAAWILYEDDFLLVLNKPAGMPTQAGTGHSKSLDRMLAGYYKDSCQPKLVHRLDKDTTGCLLMAKGRESAAHLIKQFRGRETQKIYWALVHGRLKEREGEISAPLLKAGAHGYEKMVVGGEGAHAITAFKNLSSFGKHWHLMHVEPRTGRTHQIRAHMAAMGTPIVGDGKYGGQKMTSDDVPLPSHFLFLHARQLTFEHPETKQSHTVVAPLSDPFQNVLDYFQFKEE